MIALYVASSEEAVGKTTIGAGVGKYLLGENKKVGFLKPIIADKRPKEDNDSDAVFMKQILALSEPVNSLCPLVGKEALTNKVKQAYAKASRGKDVVIVEGMCGQSPDDNLSKASYQIVKALKARVIIVEGYSNQSSRMKLIDTYKGFGENLSGIILNKVPRSQLKRVHDEISPQFDKAGINVLGVLPEDRILFTLTVGELTNYIQGEILNNAEKAAELVENFMVGAMYVDSGIEYFGRKTNKAVVVKDDRPDMQLAALETSTKCLVISGDKAPIYSVRYRAEDKGVPIILTKSDANTIVKSLEDALDKARFNQAEKLPKLSEIMEQHLSLQAISKKLGLAG
ncbi:MAG: DRTGG domain-containing protein [Dehalococcoidales bacterium]